jgi:hypothetical protein
MRYRITLAKDAVSDMKRMEPAYEAVVYRDFNEVEANGREPPMMKTIFSIANVYQKLFEEMKGQSAFRIVKIEEVPSD